MPSLLRKKAARKQEACGGIRRWRRGADGGEAALSTSSGIRAAAAAGDAGGAAGEALAPSYRLPPSRALRIYRAVLCRWLRRHSRQRRCARHSLRTRGDISAALPFSLWRGGARPVEIRHLCYRLWLLTPCWASAHRNRDETVVRIGARGKGDAIMAPISGERISRGGRGDIIGKSANVWAWWARGGISSPSILFLSFEEQAPSRWLRESDDKAAWRALAAASAGKPAFLPWRPLSALRQRRRSCAAIMTALVRVW